MQPFTEQFRSAIAAAGLNPPEVVYPDGALHRFSSNGKAGDLAGWYVLHGNHAPAGAFGDWRTGVTQKWRAESSSGDVTPRLTPQAVRTLVSERESARLRRKEAAQRQAVRLWNRAIPVQEHPYLQRKHVNSYGLRGYRGCLVIPAYAQEALQTLQFIASDGGKRFLRGGVLTGAYFCFGAVQRASALCVAEGYATAATIHDATALPTVMAFNAGNLRAVTRYLRGCYPHVKLIVCADDDAFTANNPGLEYAKKAAMEVGGVWVKPEFGSRRPCSATDFNDMAELAGMKSVKDLILGLK